MRRDDRCDYVFVQGPSAGERCVRKAGSVSCSRNKHQSPRKAARNREHTRERNAERLAGDSVCCKAGCPNIAPPGAVRCRPCDAVRSLALYHRLREAFLDLYGRACACCGSTDDLSLDHAKGTGGEHRQSSAGKRTGNRGAYRDATAEYRPDLYRVLCRDCNSNAGKHPDNQCRIDHMAS